MALLTTQIQKQVRTALAEMTGPIKVALFTQGEGGATECEFCAETRQLLEELAALSDKITLEVRDFIGDAELAKEYGVDKIPAIVVLGGGLDPKDHGIRLYGIPSGYEFSTLIEDLKMVSRGEHGLSAETLEAVSHLRKPVHIQVYVTPTCPYCPRAVLLAHKLAIASDLVTADMVEASEFPHLAGRYHVHGVPRTIIDEVIQIEGAVPEAALVSELMRVTDEVEMNNLRAEWEAHLRAHAHM